MSFSEDLLVVIQLHLKAYFPLIPEMTLPWALALPWHREHPAMPPLVPAPLLLGSSFRAQVLRVFSILVVLSFHHEVILCCGTFLSFSFDIISNLQITARQSKEFCCPHSRLSATCLALCASLAQVCAWMCILFWASEAGPQTTCMCSLE